MKHIVRGTILCMLAASCVQLAQAEPTKSLAEILSEILKEPPRTVYWFSDRPDAGKLKGDPFDAERVLTGPPRDRTQFAGTAVRDQSGAKEFKQIARELGSQADDVYVVTNGYDGALYASSAFHFSKRVGHLSPKKLAADRTVWPNNVHLLPYTPNATPGWPDFISRVQKAHNLPIGLIAPLARNEHAQ